MAELTCEEKLADLLARKSRLQRQMTSGVAEIDQPQLGRTTYRSVSEMSAQIMYLDGQIAELLAACGISTPAQSSKRRRPIYPVVTEI